MSRLLRSSTWMLCASAVFATALSAQGSSARRLSAKPVGIAPQASAAANPSITLYGGLATGDGAFNMGPALGASFNWSLESLPFNFRVDPYFAYHSTEDDNADGSAWFLGASGNLELAFRTAESTTEPYLFGGVGLYYNSVSIDTPGPGDFDDSSVDAGFGLGGGVRFGGFTLEAKMRDIDEFTTVAFMVGFMLGGR